jgi:hypothetical protein
MSDGLGAAIIAAVFAGGVAFWSIVSLLVIGTAAAWLYRLAGRYRDVYVPASSRPARDGDDARDDEGED